MRHLFLAALFCCIAAPSALAQDATASKSKASPDRVQLVEDDANGVLRIVIDGKEVGRFDAEGLHVEGLVSPTKGTVLPFVNEPAQPLSNGGDGTP